MTQFRFKSRINIRTAQVLCKSAGLYLWSAILLLGVMAVTALGQSERSDDQQMVAGLRDRQLFELGEAYVKRRLADTELSAIEQGNLVIELIQLRVAAAIQAEGANRDALWQQAFAAGEQFLANRSHPRELVIRVQVALARLSEGRLLAQQLSAGIPGNDLRNQAVQKIAQSRRDLEQIVRDVARAIPDAANTSGTNSLSADELRSLQTNIRYQIALCNLESAKLFPEDQVENRADALLQVVSRLNEVANQTNDKMPLWWSIQIGRVEAYRLQGDMPKAMEQMRELSSSKVLTTDRRKSDLLQQQIELAMDLGRGDPVQLVAAARTIQHPTPELDLALVRLMMQTGANARAVSERDKWQTTASEMTKLIQQNHGPYWGRLAELAVIGDVSGGTDTAPVTSTNLDILMRVGDEAWRKKNFEDALKAFEKAYTQAAAENNAAVAMVSGMKAARVLEQQNRNRESGERLVRLANAFPDQDGTPAAHLRGCWNLGRAAGKDKTLVEEYARQLSSHLNQWEDSKTSNQARIWLGRLQGSQKKWKEAFDTLVAVTAESSFLADAASLLPTVANGYLQQLKSDGQSTQAATSEIVQAMSNRLAESGISPNDSWTRGNRALLLSTVRVGLTYGRGDAAEFARLLQRALVESDDADESWRWAAATWLVVALAGQKETVKQAVEAVAQVPQVDALLLDGYRGVDRLVTTADPNQVISLKLALVERALANANLEASQRNGWLSRKSQLLVAAGRGAEAIDMLEALVKANPRRAELQIALARALTGTAGKGEAALLQWRKVAAGSKQYSSGWFEAKYHVARLLADQGKREDAKSLLDYIKIPPGWDKSEYKEKFDQLYSELSR